MSDDVTNLAKVLAVHRYALGHEGILCDGEVAWLACTCGWKENVELPEDDITIAEAAWEAHLAHQTAPLIGEARLIGAARATSDAIAAYDELVERVEALAGELKAEFDAYRLEDPTYLRVGALIDPEATS